MRYTYNKAYRTEGAAHLEVASLLASGELTKDREPRVQPYTDRTGKTKFKITVKSKAAA